MATDGSATRDDRVLTYTRGLSLFITPFLCFTAPFLVFGAWLANRRFAAPAGVDEPRLSSVARWIVGLIGLLALVQGRPKHRVRHPRQGQERQ